MTRLKFIPGRLLQVLPVAFGVTIIVFFMIHLLPGDPALAVLGEHATSSSVAALHRSWGLDRPLWDQYLMFLGRLLHGDLGTSLYFREAVSTLVIQRVPATLLLVLYAVVLVVIISVPLAAVAALRPGGPADHAVRVVPMIGLGMPNFWLGIMLVLLLAVRVRFFPVGGYGDGFAQHLWYLFLPALTISVSMAPIVIRSLRASMISVLSSEYIATARAKGVRGLHLIVGHVLRNAAIPTVTVLGVNIGYLIGGTLVIEQVFALPGIGSLMITAIFNRDFPVVQGVTLVMAVIVVVIGILTDVFYTLLDPRVRLR